MYFPVLCSVQDPETVLKEADAKLEAVRQKIGQIAEELRGEDIYQFHRAFTPGKLPQTCDEERKQACNLAISGCI